MPCRLRSSVSAEIMLWDAPNIAYINAVGSAVLHEFRLIFGDICKELIALPYSGYMEGSCSGVDCEFGHSGNLRISKIAILELGSRVRAKNKPKF